MPQRNLADTTNDSPQGSETLPQELTVAGAGISGVLIALGALMEALIKGRKDIHVTIIDPSEGPLEGNTSCVQPGRLTAGWHYPDIETARECAKNMVEAFIAIDKVLKIYHKRSLRLDDFAGTTMDRDAPDRNTLYIPADDEASAQQLLAVNKAIQTEFQSTFDKLDDTDKVLIRRLMPSWETVTRARSAPILSRILDRSTALALKQDGRIPPGAKLDSIVQSREMQWNIPAMIMELRRALSLLEEKRLLTYKQGSVEKIHRNNITGKKILTISLPNGDTTTHETDEAVFATYDKNFQLHHQYVTAPNEPQPMEEEEEEEEEDDEELSLDTTSQATSSDSEEEEDVELLDTTSQVTPPSSDSEEEEEDLELPQIPTDPRSTVPQVTARVKVLVTVKVTPNSDTMLDILPSQMMVYDQQNALMLTPFPSEEGGLYKATVGLMTNIAETTLVSGHHNGTLQYRPYTENPVYKKLTDEDEELLRVGNIPERLKQKIGDSITEELDRRITGYNFEKIEAQPGVVISLGGSDLTMPQSSQQEVPEHSIHSRKQKEVVDLGDGVCFFYTVKANWFNEPLKLGVKLAKKLTAAKDVENTVKNSRELQQGFDGLLYPHIPLKKDRAEVVRRAIRVVIRDQFNPTSVYLQGIFNPRHPVNVVCNRVMLRLISGLPERPTRRKNKKDTPKERIEEERENHPQRRRKKRRRQKEEEEEDTCTTPPPTTHSHHTSDYSPNSVADIMRLHVPPAILTDANREGEGTGNTSSKTPVTMLHEGQELSPIYTFQTFISDPGCLRFFQSYSSDSDDTNGSSNPGKRRLKNRKRHQEQEQLIQPTIRRPCRR